MINNIITTCNLQQLQRVRSFKVSKVLVYFSMEESDEIDNHVTENQILVDSRTHEIFGTWTVIDRYSLSLDYPFIQGHNCEVVDYDPIEKIRDIKSKDKKL